MTQALIIAGCKKGDRQAQKVFFELYSKGMLALCRRYVKEHLDAEEMLLNGFYKFFANIGRFEYTDDGRTLAWLKNIMVNECLMLLRKKKLVTFTTGEHTEDMVLAEDVLGRMNTNDILKLIDTLPVGYRIVFNMYVIEGYDHKEIAAILEISEGTSRSQLSRAKTTLQKLIKESNLAYAAG